MLVEIKNITSDKGELRKFGIISGIILSLIGCFFFWQKRDFYFYFFIISLIFFLFSFVFPIVLKPIQKIFMSISIIIGWFVTRVIMIVIFYLIVTPIGLMLRLSGKDFLNKNNNNNSSSYWIPKENDEFNKQKYENQF